MIEQDCACSEISNHSGLLMIRSNQLMDSDCACAYTPCAEFTSADLTGTWRGTRSQNFPLPGGWQGMFTPGSSVSLVVLNQPAYELWMRFQQTQNIETLNLKNEETQALLEMAYAGLIQPQENSYIQPTTRNLQLSSWLHLTDRCNLRCS